MREAVDWFCESSSAARRDGSVDALRLMTAHRAKGAWNSGVIVMDWGDWSRSEDERRLLYVSVTRAKETLTLFRAGTSSNPFIADLRMSIACVATSRASCPTIRCCGWRRWSPPVEPDRLP